MHIDFAFICDYADVGTKINALGIGFDTIQAAQVPCTHPLFFIVVQLRSSVVESGQKNLEISLIDEDGKEILPPLKRQFNVPKPATGSESIGRIAVALRNVQFPRYGLYSVHVAINGHEVYRVPLKITQPPQQPPKA